MGKLYVVHCVDTEGPLRETIDATFERLRKNKAIDIPPSEQNLVKLQKKQINLGGREAEIADYLHPKRLSYLKNWDEVTKMLRKITSEAFRKDHSDPYGNLYTFSWFLIDIIGYANNPREKSTGFHSVWDHFHEAVTDMFDDTVGWHFHTVPVNGNATEYNTCWTNNDWHEQSLCRRLIERRNFPSLFRAGGHIERNDLSFWLEQFIPFDFSCRSYDPNSPTQYMAGDINDWRGAPHDWSPFNPSFYDYRKAGKMKRTIFRTLDIDSNACVVNELEVEKAFFRASSTPTILSVSSHDRRDMESEIKYFMDLVKKVSKNFPQVSWRHSNALEAAKSCLNISTSDVELKITACVENGLILINSNKPLFGPYPFFAVQENGQLFYRDNLTIEGDNSWAYKIPKDRKITSIGIGGVSKAGEVCCKVLTL